MGLNFPNNPSNGDIFADYQYDSAINAWRSISQYGSLPCGAVIPWASAVVPAGWLLCDGSPVSRSTYSSLYAALGGLSSPWGQGDGSSTFNVPDLRGRTLVGKNGGTFSSLASTGGTESVTLTEAQMPSHKHNDLGHTHGDSGHSHGQYVTANSGGPAVRRDYQSDGSSWTYPQNANVTTSYANIATNYANISFTGGGQAHTNLQPYAVVNYIIKTTVAVAPTDTELAVRVGEVEQTANSFEARVTQAENDINNLEAWRGSNLPVFQARLAANHSRSGGDSWAKISNLSTVEVNQGNHYNSSLSRFVAPVAGVYDFTASFHQSTSATGPAIAFVKNNVTGTVDGMVYFDSYKTTTINRKFSLLAGDFVEVWSRNVNSTTFTFDTGWGGLFSGQLLN